MRNEKVDATFGFPEELLDQAEKCAEERNFRDLEHFVNKAVRDAVNAEDPFTEEEVREEIREAREAYEEGDSVSLEEVMEELEN